MKTTFISLFLLLSILGNAQCPYPTANTQLGEVRTLCVGTDRPTTTNLSINVNSTNFVAFNVVQGFSYRFIIAANLYAADNENINIYDFTTNAPLANISGAAGATLNWTATFSGQIKVVLSQGTACIQTNTTDTTLLTHIISVGNTSDLQTAFGTNNWLGHAYDWTGAAPPGGTSPATPTATTPFTNAEYVGNFLIGTQNFNQGYGGDNVCFNVFSNGVNRTSILTDTFAVRYRMNSTLASGCYILTIRGDDGIRVYIDNQLVFDRWLEQSPTVYSNVLVYLDGNADIVFDHYENGGQNVADIAIAPYNSSTNTIATPTPSVVCSGVTPAQLNATSYVYNGNSVNPTINYQWQVSTDNVTFNNIVGATNEDYTSPAIVTAVTEIRYYRRIVSAAANAAACSFISNSVQITTSGSSLGTPTATAGSSAICNSFFANWNAVSGATSYTIEVSTTNTFATLVGIYNNFNVGNVTTYQITGLTGNTDYFYRIRAISGCGASNVSNIIIFGTLPVSTPTTNVTANSCGQFTINWTAMTNATSYQVDISTVNTFASFITGYNNLNIGNVLNFTTGLLTDATVYFRIRAVGPCGSSGNSTTTTVNLGTTTWNGTTWSNSVPSLAVLAVINGGYNTTTNGDFDACRVIVTTTGNLNIAPNNFVTIQNELQNNGTVTVQNNGSLVQINNASVNSGNINVIRTANIRLQDYVYWSSPVENFSLPSVSTSTPSNYFWKWNTSISNSNGGLGNWVNTSEVMVAAKGYIVRAPNGWNAATPTPFTTTFAGKPNNGIIATTIERASYTGANYAGTNGVTITRFSDNWNLIGNPYPSALNSNAFLTANTNIEGAVRIWTHATLPVSSTNSFYNSFAYNYTPNDYIVYNGTATTSGPAGFNGNIGSGQSFFVVMNDGAATTSTVTFNNAMRSKSYTNNQFYKNESITKSIENIEKHRIWLDLVSPNRESVRSVIGYVENATNEKDRLYDAYSSYKPGFNLYSILNDEILSIQGKSLPFLNTDRVSIGIKVPTNGRYTIAIAAVDGIFENGNQPVYLEDKILNTIHNLSNSPYEFDLVQGINNERFVLRYNDAALSSTDFNSLNSTVSISILENVIKINSLQENIKNLEIYDVLGRILISKSNVNAKHFDVHSLLKNNQALIVKVILENDQIIIKKIIF